MHSGIQKLIIILFIALIAAVAVLNLSVKDKPIPSPSPSIIPSPVYPPLSPLPSDSGQILPESSLAKPMKLISRDIKSYASSGESFKAADGDWDSRWVGQIPGRLTYDLSGVPVDERRQIILFWTNDPRTSIYDHSYYKNSPESVDGRGYNNLGDYTIEANSAPGGNLPVKGWVSLINVSGNTYHSRQHLINLSGYNWVRINITESDGNNEFVNAEINMNLYDASLGARDDWLFLGDSITQYALEHRTFEDVKPLSDLIAQAIGNTYSPLFENGGIGGTVSRFGADNIHKWLEIFPGKYVTLNWGTADIGATTTPEDYYINMEKMVLAVLDSGEIPVIPKIPWSPADSYQTKVPPLNSQVDKLYKDYPQIIKGPDLWRVLYAKPFLFGDTIHPNTKGTALIREAWKDVLLKTVYTY